MHELKIIARSLETGEKFEITRGLVMKWFNKNYNQKVERFRIEHHSEN